MKTNFIKAIQRSAGIMSVLALTGSTSFAQVTKLYGMGSEGKGIFEYDHVANTIKTLSDFTTPPANGTGGYGSLVLAPNGKLYGMTKFGGSTGKGVIFEIDVATGSYTRKFDFGTTNGENPEGSLMLAKNGKLYGLTYEGGSSDKGVLFEYVPGSTSITVLVNFTGAANGELPKGTMIQASNNKLYGTTWQGGSKDRGVIFEYDITTNTLSVKYEFGVMGVGNNPNGELMEAFNGKLYGLMETGGSEGKGCIYEYDITNSTFTKVHQWGVTNQSSGATAEGSKPKGGLRQGNDSLLYGCTSDGGITGGGSAPGVLFTFNTSNNTYTKKLTFDVNAIGQQPNATLLLAKNGKFYGMAKSGQSSDIVRGSIFEYDAATNTMTKEFGFNFSTDIQTPISSLIEVDVTALSTGFTAGKKAQVYPNPSAGRVNVVLPELDNFNVVVSDIQGKRVLDKQFTQATQVELDLTALAKGVYILQINSSAFSSSEKLIIR